MTDQPIPENASLNVPGPAATAGVDAAGPIPPEAGVSPVSMAEEDFFEEPVPRPKTLVREYVETILTAVLFVLFIKTFVSQQFKIPTSSMEDTLLIGDHLMVNKFIFGTPTGTLLDSVLPTRGIRRKDVVVFRFPDNPDMDFIKRAAAVPGDTINLKHKVLFVNGEEAHEPYKKLSRHGLPHVGDFMADRAVPAGEYFMLGDNRDNSNDSRFWGTVPRPVIRGRAFAIWWSFDEKEGEYLKRDARSRVSQAYSKIRHFVGSTRWNRMFTLIR